MSNKVLLLAFVALLASPACQLNKDTGPFDSDPNQVNPAVGGQNSNGVTPGQTGGQNGNQAAQGNTTGQTQPTSGNANNANQTATATPALRLIGRVPSTTQQLSWPGTGVEATFRGTKGSATFSVVSGTSYVAVAVDGAAPTKVLVQNNNAIPFGPVAQGNHTVRLTKLNEAELGVIKLVSLTTDGNLLVTPTPARRLEFVGDSITLGYGVEGVRPCDNNSAMENVLKAWSGVTAATLDADVSVLAWSGHGLLRNAVGVADDATLPTIYRRATALDAVTKYDFTSAAAPQAVIINLGTNDFTYTASGSTAGRAQLDQDAFVDAYATFVKSIRSAYPAATIVLASSPMLTDTYPTAAEAQHTSLVRAITAVQTQLADANVRILDIPTMDTTVAACDYHPSAAEQATMAASLVTELKAALKW